MFFFPTQGRSTSSKTNRRGSLGRHFDENGQNLGRSRRRWWLTLLLVLSPVHAGVLENQLNARWRGAWVILKADSYSTCSGAYTNNEIYGDLVTSKGTQRFEAGELGRIHKIDVKRSRIDVLIDLHTHVLLPYQDGPFQLYKDVACQLEYLIKVPREMIKAKDPQAVERLLVAFLERHSNQRAATRSPDWNRREREDYPHDYQQTLRDYEAWKVAQHNQAIEKRIQFARAESRRILHQVKSDRGFALGFAAGIVTMRQARFGDCETLLSNNFSGYRKQASNEQSYDWKHGFEEGQKLVYYMVLAERLPTCFL